MKLGLLPIYLIAIVTLRLVALLVPRGFLILPVFSFLECRVFKGCDGQEGEGLNAPAVFGLDAAGSIIIGVLSNFVKSS